MNTLIMQAKKKISKKEKGFTLIELIAVIAILAILVLIAAPRFLNYTRDAEVAAMRADVKVLSDAAMLYNIDSNELPTKDGTVTLDAEFINYLKSRGLDVTENGEVTVGEETKQVVHLIDFTKIQNYVKNIRNDIEDYVIISQEADALVGEVFHFKGVKDKDGNNHYGVQ